MIKELFLAIILGALMGFGVTGGFFALQKNQVTQSATTQNAIADSPQSNENQASEISPALTQESSLDNQESKITIVSPENETVTSTSKITLKGVTAPNSIVVIVTPIKSYTLSPDKEGNFTASLELESGINQIKIVSIDEQDNQEETQLYVTYSTAKLE